MKNKELEYRIRFMNQPENNLQEVWKKIHENFPAINLFTLTGELGSGKTAFVRSVVKSLDSPDDISSPSFSLINEYILASGRKIYHIDLYRIKTLEEAINLGIEEYLYTDNLCFIEWPEIIDSILPEEHLKIRFEIIDESTRNVILL